MIPSSPGIPVDGSGEEVGCLVSRPSADYAPVAARSFAMGTWLSGVVYIITGITTQNPIVVWMASLFAVTSMNLEGVSRTL